MHKRSLALSTDLYELTMAAAYFENGVHGHRAVFELFTRSLPRNRSYLIAAGLEQVIEYLWELRFAPDEIDYLRTHPSFKRVSGDFFDYLSDFRFSGDVWAVPEGSVVFGFEPLVRVEAPVIEAQIVETFLLSTINFQTMIASKAARIVTAAAGRSVIEFGTRRAHGSEAGLFAARAAFIGGCPGTSNVEAGHLFGIPTFGTMAHSFVMLFDQESDAFRAFVKVFPDTATILVDTYDTIAAVKMLADHFDPVASIRLDSGDLVRLSQEARHLLDAAGRTETRIFASGDLNEYRIAQAIADGAEVDAFGVGTELATSYDAPALGGVYKLVGSETDGRFTGRIKLSPDKATYPGPKQVWRLTGPDGRYQRDIIAGSVEPPPDTPQRSSWEPLLVPAMKDGNPEQLFTGSTGPAASRATRAAYLKEAQERATGQLKRLRSELLDLDSAGTYPVEYSERLKQERTQIESELLDENQ